MTALISSDELPAERLAEADPLTPDQDHTEALAQEISRMREEKIDTLLSRVMYLLDAYPKDAK